jgi:hypothetical protein
MVDSPREKCRVLIFDDQPDKARRLRDSLTDIGAGRLEILAPPTAEIEEQFDALYARREALDSGKEISGIPCKVDDSDVLIVDYDLRELKDHRGFATGEEIAYSARLFSKAKIIVVVNHANIGVHNFDLTLQRDREFRADVYVGAEQCANPGLWFADSGHQGFLPWSWIPLTEDVESFSHCLEAVKRNEGKNVLDFFGLSAQDVRPSPEMLAYLGLKRDEDVPIGQVLRQPSLNYVRPKDLERLANGTERYARVATALLRKWFRRWIVPTQTLLADLPHLAMALPWGLRNYEDRQSWNILAKCGRSRSACELSDSIHTPILQNAFRHSEWTGRPTFLLERARAASEVSRGSLPEFKPSGLPKIAFAEDLSRFIDADSAVEYNVTLNGEAQLRSVSISGRMEIDGPKYGLDTVVYSPESLIL